MDKYLPTKYGIIFREKLYVAENTIATLYLRLAEVEGFVGSQQAAGGGGPGGQAPPKGQAPKKGGDQ